MGGKEKIFVEVGGTPILDRIMDRIAHQVDRMVVNANGDAARFNSSGLTIIPDLPDDTETPLAGLHAAFHWAKTHDFEALLTVPSDTPFLPRDLVAKLAAARKEAVIAASGGQEHYLTGLWAVSLGDALDEAVRSTPLVRVKDWAKQANAAIVAWPDEPFDPFFNVNTPEDLAEAQGIEAEFAP
ncbi:MAG: molybdenum cofactor guanylyltransferase [Rhizobiales bacterium]|nr:molybdenum cofactor guanylyltransferase [Hyphomicrobiales bacterium]